MVKYEVRLEQDLNRIHEEFSGMGQEVAASVKSAIQALLNGDEELANRTGIRDQIINRRLIQINRLCHNFTARHLPAAGHLRRISSLLRLVNELERIGDYAVTICRETIHLSNPPKGPLRRNMELMSGLARQMLENALEAYLNENNEQAKAVMGMAERVEMDLGEAFGDLVAQGEKRAEEISDLLDMHTVFYMLERISDRAKNICEETLWVVSGEVKPEKRFSIIFLDDDNSCSGPMAEALARHGYPQMAEFFTASLNPCPSLHSGLKSYLGEANIPVPDHPPQGTIVMEEALTNTDPILIDLRSTEQNQKMELPFHCFYFAWDLGAVPKDGGDLRTARSQFMEMHRTLSMQLAELMDILVGGEEA
ncbi:MAG: phosphate signaling complex protein PhoU [Magnetococcales bacterium]|nr:phosphate signaling complex protein PhoU [Magnetococcales bacterium]